MHWIQPCLIVIVVTVIALVISTSEEAKAIESNPPGFLSILVYMVFVPLGMIFR